MGNEEMKRKVMLNALFVLILVMAIVMTGCSDGKRVFDESGDITVSTEFEVYGGDIEIIGCIIENNTDKAAEYSAAYSLEVLEGEEWTELTSSNTAVDTTLYTIEGGEKAGFAADMTAFGDGLEDGTYRVVKQIGEKYYAGEFTIGQSDITAETPFGMAAFYSVPADYSADSAAADGCAVIGENSDVSAFTAFAEKVGIGLPAMVRIAGYDDAGGLTLTDIVYDGECYNYKVRTAEGVTEHKYPFMFTDEEAVYLSDCVSNGNLNSFPDAVKIPVVTAEQTDITELVAAVKEVTRAALSNNSTVYMCYSPDGMRYIRVLLENSIVKVHTDVLKYIVGTPDGVKEYGSDDADQIANQIVLAEWLDDTRVILSFKTVYDINYFETRDTAKDEVERHSYSISYTVKDGEVSYIG